MTLHDDLVRTLDHAGADRLDHDLDRIAEVARRRGARTRRRRGAARLGVAALAATAVAGLAHVSSGGPAAEPVASAPAAAAASSPAAPSPAATGPGAVVTLDLDQVEANAYSVVLAEVLSDRTEGQAAPRGAVALDTHAHLPEMWSLDVAYARSLEDREVRADDPVELPPTIVVHTSTGPADTLQCERWREECTLETLEDGSLLRTWRDDVDGTTSAASLAELQLPDGATFDVMVLPGSLDGAPHPDGVLELSPDDLRAVMSDPRWREPLSAEHLEVGRAIEVEQEAAEAAAER